MNEQRNRIYLLKNRLIIEIAIARERDTNKQERERGEFIYIFIVTYSKTKQISNLNYICRMKPILMY